MGRYVTWDDVVNRYPTIDNVGGATEVGSAFIGYVEAQIDGMLAPAYSVPFSSNNVTVQDLCVELVYLRVGNLKNEQRKELRKMFDERIQRLLEGSEQMVTTSGDTIGTVSGTVWSSTKDYHPVFGMDETPYFVVDSSQIIDERNDRA